jgi:hypothetical protein
MVAVPQTLQGEIFMLKRVGLLFVLLTMMVLAAGTVQAAPRMGPRPASESGGVLDRVFGWLFNLFPTGPANNPTGVIWEAEGSHWDPNGIH